MQAINSGDTVRIVNAVLSEIDFPVDGDFRDSWNRAWASFPSHGIVRFFENYGLAPYEDPDLFADDMLGILYENTVFELEYKKNAVLEEQGDGEGNQLASIYRTILNSIDQADREELRQAFRHFAVESGSPAV